MGHSGAQASLSPSSRQVSIHVYGGRESLDATFQSWKFALCLCGVAGVDALWCQLVSEWRTRPMHPEWTAGVEGARESCFSSPPLVSTILAVYSQPFETLRAQSISLSLREAFQRNSRKKSSPRSSSLRASSGSALASPIQSSSFLHEELGLGPAQKPELGKHTDTDSS